MNERMNFMSSSSLSYVGYIHTNTIYFACYHCLFR